MAQTSGKQGALRTLSHRSLRERALDALREAIILGEITQGAHLAETPLSTELGISRGTLREALRQLQQEGLVVGSDNGRLRVRQLDKTTIREVFEVRAALEGLAARLISAQPEREQSVATLHVLLSRFHDVPTEDLMSALDLDLAFHRQLCRLSGNASLLRSWEALDGTLRMAIMHAGPDRARKNMSFENHVGMVDALTDAEGAVFDEVYASVMSAVPSLVGDPSTDQGADGIAERSAVPSTESR